MLSVQPSFSISCRPTTRARSGTSLKPSTHLRIWLPCSGSRNFCARPSERAPMRRRRAPSWALGGLAAAQHEHARGQPGAVEEVRRQTDHRLDEILLEQEASDVALDAATEQRALGQHDRHATGPVGHGLDHVLYPGEVAARIRGQAREGAPPGIALPDLAPPLLERER